MTCVALLLLCYASLHGFTLAACDADLGDCSTDSIELLQAGTQIVKLMPQEHAQNMQLEQKVKVEEPCALPSNGKWCRVSVGSLPAFNMAVYASNDIVSKNICDSGTWELSEQDVADLGTPGHALDIGANIGFYSLLLAANKWNITAFEPLPANLAFIEASLCANPNLKSKITLNKIGLGSKADHCILNSHKDNQGDAIAKCGIQPENFHQDGYQVRSAFDVQRLDDVLSNQHVEHIDFVKMDVEGYECQVMAGAQSLLTKYRPRIIQSEVWPEMLGCLSQDYFSSFAKAHYKVTQDIHCQMQNFSRPDSVVNRYMCKDADDATALLENDRHKIHRIVRLQLHHPIEQP